MQRNAFTLLNVFLSILIINACVEKEIKLPEGWRMPSGGELKDKWRDEDANRYVWFKADFNGDGIEDQANVLISKDNKNTGIFAFVSQKDDKYKTFELKVMDIEYIEYVGLSVVSPGRYVTLCGKGGLYDCGDYPDEIVLS